MMVHIRVQPFKRISSNLIETASLLILLCIAVMNLVKAVYFDSGEIPHGNADLLLRFYDIVEQSFVTFFPLVVLVILLVLGVIRIIVLPCDPIGRRKLSGEDEERGSQKSGGSNGPGMQGARYNDMPGSATPAEGAQFPHQLTT